MLEEKFFHEDVAKTHDVFVEANLYDRDNKLVGTTACIVQELADGGIELYNWVSDWRRDTYATLNTRAALDYPGVAFYFFQSLIEGVAAMHRRRIFHNDIKIENLMVSRTTKALKIVDLGLGKVLRDGRDVGDRVHSIDAPYVHYLAPEVRAVHKGEATVPEAADVWSCGVVLHAVTVRCDWSRSLYASFEDPLSSDTFAGRTVLEDRFAADHDDGPALKDLLSRSASRIQGASPRQFVLLPL